MQDVHLPNNDIVFQILDWNSFHSEDDEGKKTYTIRLFGRTKQNKTIYVQVAKFTPFFYVRIPKHWRTGDIENLVKYAQDSVPKAHVDGLTTYRLDDGGDMTTVTPSSSFANTTTQKYKVVEKCSFWGFSNYQKFRFIILCFKDFESFRVYERVFKRPIYSRFVNPGGFKFELFESNIVPFLRYMHMRGFDAVGWVKVAGNKYKPLNNEVTCCEINIEAQWNSLDRVEDNTINSYVIASFDIECTSEDGMFPQASRAGDNIIQIGTTFSRYGEDECYYQHVITLGSCDKLDQYGIDVESYETEEEVLLAWTRLLRKHNPDIITGYNILGFDMKYMHDRCEYFKNMKKGDKGKTAMAFAQLSRVTNEVSAFKDTILSSSALGDNKLFYYEMTGRIIIDILKVVLREYKLDSYKLDSVAAYFIKEKIIKLTHENGMSLIQTKNTYGLKEEQFITVYYTDGISTDKHMDGKKFKVVKLTPTSIIVDDIIDDTVMKGGFTVYWCQAKDDITPKDIFKYQKEGPKERAIIAKYCIKDCSLCNKLITKLQIITNNVGMANVCSVPLSYLFMRGQSIKIFSLVAKKCRLMNHLIPTIKKNYKTKEEKKKAAAEENKIFEKYVKGLNKVSQEDDDQDMSYEGALVIPPKADVYYEPIPVLDYSSLYPKSMIERNLSHECYVMDDETYGNLPGYKYHVITYITQTITEPYSRIKLNQCIDGFLNKLNNYIIEDVKLETNKLRRHINVYNKNRNGQKKDRIAEILADNKEIKIINYEISKFADKLDGTKGIIPGILNDLLNARSKYKKLMDTETNPFIKNIYNGLQLAYKVTANSVYGATGASASDICMKQIAASTTATGRERLAFSQHFIENVYSKLILYALEDKNKFLDQCDETFATCQKFNTPKKGWSTKEEFCELFYKTMNEVLVGKTVDPKIIYGDSILGNEPLILMESDGSEDESGINNNIIIKKIENLDNGEKGWCEYTNFKNSELNDCILESIKSGNYDITELPNVVRQMLGVSNIKISDAMMAIIKNKLIEDQQNRFQKEQLNVNYKVWTSNGWSKIKRVIRHKTCKDIYTIITKTSIIEVTEDHSLLDHNGNILKPINCSKGTRLLYGFPFNHENSDFKKSCQLFDNDDSQNNKNSRYEEGNFEYDFDNKYECQMYYYWAKMNGYNVKVELGSKIRLVRTKEEISNPNEIIEVRKKGGTFGWVYDLETQEGCFHAGVGELIVKNTDSIFINLNITDLATGKKDTTKDAMKTAIKLGQWASHTIYLLLPEPQEQAYEKVLWPFMILTKKRYVGNLYEDDPNKFYQKSMGIVLKRRDNAQIVKIVCGGIVDYILNKSDPFGAVKFTKDILKKILNGNYPIEKFIITKTLKEEYADREKIVHVVLADRIAERDPGNKPMPNDRIPYVYIEVDHEVKLQGERVETPDYVISNGLKIDYLFYITNQIKKPAVQFLELIVKEPEHIFDEYITRAENKKKGCRPIKSYFGEDKIDDSDFDILNNETKEENHVSIKERRKQLQRAHKLIRKKKTKQCPDYDPTNFDIFL